MEASTRIVAPVLSFEPNTDKIKRNLLKKGVIPTPKIIHTLRKKEIQKFNRKSKKLADKTLEKPLSEAEKQTLLEESHFRQINREYRAITKVFKSDENTSLMVGKPWERLETNNLREFASGSKEFWGGKLKGEPLVELSEILAKRNCNGDKNWLLDEDIEQGDWMEEKTFFPKRQLGDTEAIQFLVKRLSATDLSMKDWKFSRLMKQSGLQFTERNILKIVQGLGASGCWRHALSVVKWIYNRDEHKQIKSRFVYTKLLAVLGKARQPTESLQIFNEMREDCRIYPDMAAYHSISVTLGQAGLIKELVKVIDCMRLKPSKKIRNTRSKDWDPCIYPDVVVYNAVLNACVPSHQWKGVSWVMEEMRKSGLKPNGATYGLAMEVMLRSGKYDLVHKYFDKMRRSGAPPKAITYKVLVRAFWEDGKVNEAVEAVRDMERRGVVGTASVYYELARCLCKSGKWREAMEEVENMKTLSLTKPLEVTFTGLIISSMEGGHVDDCISIFQHMTNHCTPNIGTINAMLKVYGRNDMFAKAKELFEKTKTDSELAPDAFTYSSILEASATSHNWEYFEYIYKEMALCGYQIDQNKHAWLLVQASKSGKGHLLEHAFDVTLEVGEIPHLTFFNEIICQAIIQDDYERAISLLNSMAHASLQVSETQWKDILTDCQDRISKDQMQNLYNRLSNSDVLTEATILNLSKALDMICGEKSPMELGLIAACEELPNEKPANCVLDSESDNVGEKSEEYVDDTLDVLISNVGSDSDKSDIPQASEILKRWKESRHKDGIFFPFV